MSGSSGSVGPDRAFPVPGAGSAGLRLPRTARDHAGAAGVVVLLAVGIVLLLAGGVFAYLQISSEGPQTPEAAVEKLLSAASEEDLLGVLEALLPSERESFRRSLQELADELERLEIASGDLDLRDLAGFDLEFADVELQSEELRDDLAVVRLVGGTATATFDPSQLPVGPFVLELVGDELRQGEPETAVEELLPGSDGAGIATVEEGGTWYVSFWYSVAEAARVEADLPLPDPARRLAPAGAESPEGAAEELIRAAAAVDVRRLLSLLPPDEARVLHDYAPLFVPDLDAAAEELRRLVAVDVRELTLESDRSGSRALVQVRDLAVDLASLEEGIAVTIEDGCVEVREIGSGAGERACPGDPQSDGADLLEEFLPGLEPPELSLDTPELGLVTVEVDGDWYVSPTRTLLDNLTAVLRIFDRADLDELRRFGEDLLEALAGAFFGFAAP